MAMVDSCHLKSSQTRVSCLYYRTQYTSMIDPPPHPQCLIDRELAGLFRRVRQKNTLAIQIEVEP